MKPFPKLDRDTATEMSRPELDPKIKARFRPPTFEVLGIATLMTLQAVAWLGSGMFVIAHFYDVWPDVGWLLPVCGILTFVGVLRSMWLGQAQRPDGGFLMMAEVLAFLVIFRLIFLVLRPEVEGLSDANLALDAFFMSLALSQGRASGYNLFRLYLQPYELPVSEGGAAANALDGQYSVDHYASYRVLQQRWMWSGLLIVALIALTTFLLSDYAQPGKNQETIRSLLWMAGLYFGVGLPLLSFLRLRYLRTGWRLNRLNEPKPLAARWPVYVLGLVGLALIVSAALPHSTDLNPFAWIKFTPRPAGEPPPELPPILRRTPCVDNTQPGCSFVEREPPANPGEPFRVPDWISIFLLSAAVSGLIYGVLFLLARSGIAFPGLRKVSFGSFWREFLAWLRGLFAPRELAEKDVNASRRGGLTNLFGRFRRDRLPDDPRGQVRFHYRHTLERASRAGLPRSSGMTPNEYADYLNPTLTEPELKTDLEDLTRLYDEARFSPHPIVPAQVETASAQTKRLTQFLKQIKKNRSQQSAVSSQNREERSQQSAVRSQKGEEANNQESEVKNQESE